MEMSMGIAMGVLSGDRSDNCCLGFGNKGCL